VYLDEGLSLGEAQDFEKHLSACAGCREQLESWQKAGAALTAALDADAVPSTSLEEFVSACRSGEIQPVGSLGRLVQRLSAPRRVVAATVAGSFALTFALILVFWAASLSTSPLDKELSVYSNRFGPANVLALGDPNRAGEEEW